VSTHRLSEPEIVHGKWLYRPYCDSYTLSFRLAISLEQMTEISENFGGLPAVAVIDNRVVDAGRQMMSGEAVTLSFTEKQRALDAAELLDASPTFREEDDSWRSEAREKQGAILEELFSSPEQLDRFASKHGLAAQDLDREELAAQLFCP